MIDLTDIDAFDGELLMFAIVSNKWDSLGIRFVCSCRPVCYIHAAGQFCDKRKTMVQPIKAVQP